MRRLQVLLLVGNAALAATAYGTPPNEELVCRSDAPELDKYAVLRAISLDVRGTVPSMEEYAQLDAAADVPEALIDEWLASEEFVTRAVRWHRDLLWNSLSNVTLTNFQTGLTNTGGLYWRRVPGRRYRGGEVPCANTPATFDSNGRPVTTPGANGTNVEGYVEVNPYWAPTTTIRVCAFDAQEREISARGLACGSLPGLSETDCGCGTNLKWCRAADVNARMVSGFAEDVERRIADVIRNDRPYTELFTSRTAYVNGPMVHFLRHQTALRNDVSMAPLPYADNLPDLAYMAYDTWVPIQLPEGHAGLLTSPAYLLRFQSNRSRANRFYNAFLCEPFQPPAGGIPIDPAALRQPDLQRRAGCKYCHAILEPAAAHWGRWAQRGAGFLAPTAFPAQRADCTQCGITGQACSRECTDNYFTRPQDDSEQPYVGMLYAYHFLREDHRINVEQGPRYLVMSTIADNRLPACTAGHVVERLAGRAITEEERPWVQEELARQFVQGGFKYRDLVKAMVMNPVYRRAR